MSSMTTNRNYLRASEVARLFRVSRRTIQRWADDGKLPHGRTLGGQRVFDRAEIAEQLEKMYRGEEGAA